MIADSGSRRRLHGFTPLLGCQVWRGWRPFFACTLEGEPVRVVYEAIKDRVGDGRIQQRASPVESLEVKAPAGREGGQIRAGGRATWQAVANV